MAKKTTSERYCNFCGRPEKDVSYMLTGLNGNICSDCVQQAFHILAREGYPLQMPTSPANHIHNPEGFNSDTIPTPAEIKSYLDQYVIGHEEVKKVLAVAVHNHYRRLEAAEKKGEAASSPLQNENLKFVFRGIEFNIARGDKVALIGYNGLGKTTLMRIIAGTRQPTEGKAVLGHNVVPGYLSQEFAETIPPDVTVYRNAKNAWDAHGGGPEKVFRNQLGAFGFDENDVEKPAGVLSGGEKIRLAFLRLFLTAPNFLLLDEPTTHLDLDGRRLLQEALQKYTGTILLVSHDIDFVRAVATSVLEITREGLNRYPGGYDYYCEKKLEKEVGVGEERGVRSKGLGVRFQLTLVGEGPEKAKILRIAEKLQKKFNTPLSTSTSFFDLLPPVPIAEVRNLMREHDVYVLASNAQEGWGAALNEALEEGMVGLGTHEAGASAALLPEAQRFHAGDFGALARLLEKAYAEELRPTGMPVDYTAAGAAGRLMAYVAD